MLGGQRQLCEGKGYMYLVVLIHTPSCKKLHHANYMYKFLHGDLNFQKEVNSTRLNVDEHARVQYIETRLSQAKIFNLSSIENVYVTSEWSIQDSV